MLCRALESVIDRVGGSQSLEVVLASDLREYGHFKLQVALHVHERAQEQVNKSSICVHVAPAGACLKQIGRQQMCKHTQLMCTLLVL